MADEKKFELYRVEESLDELDEGIKNLTTVIEQQKKLLEVISNSGEENVKYFEKFTEDLKSGIEKYESNVAELTKRKDMIKDILKLAREDSNIEKVLYNFIVALGIDALK
jgi:t-SNARE complex subunit (syntaxin)